MLTLLTFGTLWFWFLTFVLVCIITLLVENEAGLWATIVFIASLLILNYIYKVAVFSTIRIHPGKTLLLVLSYFAIGAAWSIIKWYFYVHSKLVKYNDRKAELLKLNNLKELTPELAIQLSGYSTVPDPKEHQSDLIRWSTYWPFSMIGTILNDIVRKIWKYIYQLFQGTYQKISNHLFRNVQADMRMADEYRNRK